MICGGGTGGHVYPALAVLEILRQEEAVKPLEILYVGSEEGLEKEIVPRQGIKYERVATASLVGSPWWRIPGQILRTLWGTLQAWQILGRFRPQVILATGGYVSAPAVVAGWLQRTPILLYLPDVEPGLAVRLMSPLARRIALSFAETHAYFPQEKILITGYPVRAGVWAEDRKTARDKLGLPLDEKMLLILGGSRGAQALNRIVAKILPELLSKTWVLHICGGIDFEAMQRERDKLPAPLRDRYRLVAYLYEEMPQALVAADLGLARAGASVLGEFPAAGLPSILVPYPHARGHQEKNARFLEERSAALVLDEEELLEKLLPTLLGLLADETKRQQMAEAARRLAQPQAAKKLSIELMKLAGYSKGN